MTQQFFWGVANSAFQVEGSPAASDWKEWTQTKGRIHDGSNADQACDFWNQYNVDFEAAANLGCSMFRISIAWERIEVAEGVFDDEALEAYGRMIDAMRQRGLEPIVTLNHFVLPLWLSKLGGFAASQFPDLFCRFGVRVVKVLSAPPRSVKYWMTFNEPMVLMHFGFLEGIWPPGVKDPKRAIQALGNMALAHRQLVDELRRSKPDLRFSVAQHWRDFQSKSLWPWDRLATEVTKKLFNRQFVESLLGSHIKLKIPGAPAFKVGGFKANSLDYLGINYYGRLMISVGLKYPYIEIKEGPGPKTDMGWEIYPEGLYRILKAVASYQLPILIAENGLADRGDSHRANFIREHLRALERARGEGVDVMGYLYWSLTDNFEWSEGLSPRFGLVEMNYETGKRSPRLSFYDYNRFIQEASHGRGR